MKHFKSKASRFLALLLTFSLLSSVPVAAVEEWDSEEVYLGFESSVDDPVSAEVEQPVFTFAESEEADGAPTTTVVSQNTLQEMEIYIPDAYLSLLQDIKAGMNIPMIPAEAYSFIRLHATGTNAAGEAVDLSQNLSVSRIVWFKGTENEEVPFEDFTETAFQDGRYLLFIEFEYSDITIADNATARIDGLDKELIFSDLISNKTALGYLTFDITPAPIEKPKTLESLDVSLPEEYKFALPSLATREFSLPYGFYIGDFPLMITSVNGSTEEADLREVTLEPLRFYEWPIDAEFKAVLSSAPAQGSFTKEVYLAAAKLTSQMPISENMKVTLDSMPGILRIMTLTDEETGAQETYVLTFFTVLPNTDLTTSIEPTTVEPGTETTTEAPTTTAPATGEEGEVPTVEPPVETTTEEPVSEAGIIQEVVITIPDAFLPRFQSVKVGDTIPAIPEAAYPFINLQALGADAAGEAADFSDKVAISDIYWSKITAEDNGHFTENVTEDAFQEALYILILKFSYDGVSFADNASGKIAGLDLDVRVYDLGENTALAILSFDLIPKENPASVSLSRPNRPTAKNRKRGIELTWEAVENAKEYEIFRIREGEKLKKIATTDQLTFLDEDVYHHVQYIYYVRAKSYTKDSVSYVTEGVSKGRKQVYVKRSDKVKVDAKKGTISWIPTKDVDGYQLLVANNLEMKNGQKFTVGNVSSITMGDIPQVGLLPAGTYYIALRQYVMVGERRFVSAYHGKRKFVKE